MGMGRLIAIICCWSTLTEYRFVHTEDTIADCIRRARQVLLGVRVGGGENFKRADRTPQSPTDPSTRRCHAASADKLVDDRCTSTYFEFDPYPVRAAAYTVYRIADAPERWSTAGLIPKALYVFEIRPSGTP